MSGEDGFCRMCNEYVDNHTHDCEMDQYEYSLTIRDFQSEEKYRDFQLEEKYNELGKAHVKLVEQLAEAQDLIRLLREDSAKKTEIIHFLRASNDYYKKYFSPGTKFALSVAKKVKELENE